MLQDVLNDFYHFRFDTIFIPPSMLVRDLRKLIDNPEFADIVFVVEGRKVHANRALLAARSDHFRAMLFGRMREATALEIEIPVSVCLCYSMDM